MLGHDKDDAATCDRKEVSMDFEVHCMSTLLTKLSFFDYDKVKTVLKSVTPLSIFLFKYGERSD